MCWHAIGEEMLEQIGIVLLGYIWVTLNPIDEGDLPRRQTVIFTKVHRVCLTELATLAFEREHLRGELQHMLA